MASHGRPRRVAPGKRSAGSTANSTSSSTPKARLTKTQQAENEQHYVLRLYVTGMTQTSARAIERVRAVCEKHLQKRYELEVVDIFQLPALARDEQIIATPTLIKALPLPLRRYIGDLSNIEKVLFGLDLQEKVG
jgi:circadian clock protein KaiB